MVRLPKCLKSLICQIIKYLQIDPYFIVSINLLEDEKLTDPLEVDALTKNLRQSFEELMKVAPNLTEEHSGMLKNIQKPNRLTDRAISVITISNQEKQEILEELNIKVRIEKALNLISREIQRIKLGEEIQTEVHDEITKTQREYYLREQMKAIKKELGEDEGTVESKELEEISKKYQAYSGEERNRNINRGLLYLGEQIKKYKKISSNSISKALNFAYTNNLISETDEFSTLPAISSEGIRIEAVSKLKLVEKQLAQVDKIPQNSELIYAFAKRIYNDNQIYEINNSNDFIKYRSLHNEKNRF